MFTKTPLGEWVTRWVLDGELLATYEGSTFAFPITSATVSRTYYSYQKLDGSFVTGRERIWAPTCLLFPYFC